MATFTIVGGYSWTNGEVVTATKLNLAATPTLASDQSYTFNVGAAATPSINFTGATTSGLYFASSTIGFSIGGASIGAWGAVGLAINGVVDVTGTAGSTSVNHLQLGGSTQSTIGANGAASALTANPLGYLSAYLGTTHIIIPYYNA